LLRKQRKTLGGYFILPHPVDLYSTTVIKNPNRLNALVSSEQIRFMSKRLKQSANALIAESRIKSGKEFQTVRPASEKARRKRGSASS